MKKYQNSVRVTLQATGITLLLIGIYIAAFLGAFSESLIPRGVMSGAPEHAHDSYPIKVKGGANFVPAQELATKPQIIENNQGEVSIYIYRGIHESPVNQIFNTDDGELKISADGIIRLPNGAFLCADTFSFSNTDPDVWHNGEEYDGHVVQIQCDRDKLKPNWRWSPVQTFVFNAAFAIDLPVRITATLMGVLGASITIFITGFIAHQTDASKKRAK